MAKGNVGMLWLVLCILALSLATEAQQWGLSAVTLNNQSYNRPYYSRYVKVKGWVTSGTPGLFKNGEFTNSDNSTFRINTSGVYYVSANVIAEVGSRYYRWSWYYYYRNTFYGTVYLQNSNGYTASSSLTVTSYVPLDSSSRQVHVRISGYLLMRSGWKASIRLHYRRRSLTIKAGSTFSLLYTSKQFAFPGIQIQGKYQQLKLKPPTFSAKIKQWKNPTDSSTMPSMSDGNFVVTVNGLYHIIANIAVQRTTDVVYMFAILIDSTVETLTRTTSLLSEETATITLEGVLNLVENQTISISVSSPSQTNASLSSQYSSSVFICYILPLTNLLPGMSASFKGNVNRLPAQTWNTLKQWISNAKQPLHFGNTQLSSGKFVSHKSGVYYVSLAILIKNCSEASAKLNVKRATVDKVYSVGPDFSFVAENKECFLDVSLLLQMKKNDSLHISIKSNKNFTIQPSTTLQVLFHIEPHVWSAVQLTLKNSFPFFTNKSPVKMKNWLPSFSKLGFYSFSVISGDKIKIKVSGLYIASCNIVVNSSSNVEGQFESQFSINDNSAKSGSPCRRNKTPQSFTCTMSTLLNLLEKDTLAVQVKMSDSSGKTESIDVLASSSMSVVLVGDTRSHPAFKLSVQNNDKPYVTKAKTTTIKSPSNFSVSDSNDKFFQTAAIYSKLGSSSNGFGFNTGSGNAFFISSSMQIQLLNDGELSSVTGSTKHHEHIYSWDKTKGVTSLSSSAITFDDHFYFNFSGKASSSDFKWNIQLGSIVSGAYIGNDLSLRAFQARLNLDPKLSTNCSREWTQVGEWTQIFQRGNPGTFNNKVFVASQGGLFFLFLNFVIKSNLPKKNVQIGIFLDNELVLLASETTPNSPNFFSTQLHGVVTLETDQRVDVRIKCPSLFLINYSRDTSISAFQVDGKDLKLPGLHWRYSVTPSYYSNSNARKLIPYNYCPTQRDTKSYTMYTNYKRSTKTANTSRTGIYFVSLTGELDDKTQSSFVFSTDPSSTSCLYSSPIHFKKSNNLMKSVSASGLIFLNKGEDFALIELPTSYYHSYYSYYRYYYRHNSDVYLSLQYIGDLQTTSGFSSTLNQSVHVPKGVNFELLHTKWHSDSTCGKFATADLPMTFGRYRTLYSGVHIVTFNLRLNYSGGCHVSVCYVINGRYLHSFDRQSCFEQHMNDTSSKVTTSTFSGSELLYMNEGEQVSLKLNNTCQATILKRSSLSSFYLGTKDVLLGFSSAIGTSKATLSALPSTSYRYHSSYYYHNYNDVSTTYDVRGWTTNAKNSKMFFKRGVTYLLNEMFVCSKAGVYLIFVKLHVKSAVKGLKQSDGCVVSAQLAVDSSNTHVGVQQAFFGAANTLAFSTTIMLRKWQGLSVRFTQKTERCGKMEIGESSSFAAVYLANGMDTVGFQNVGPHVVKVPPSSVYIRSDKTELQKLTCMAVGEYPIKYQWIKYNKEIISDSSILDVRKLNFSYTSVTCVVTMGQFVTKSSSISVNVFDPTPEFIELYGNVTYDLEEKNATESSTASSYTNIVTIGVRERWHYHYWYYYYYRNNLFRCLILNEDHNNTFYIVPNTYRYSYGTKFYDLRARNNLIDRETIEEYYLNISCTNMDFKDAANATTTIHVKILDANDNLPVFERSIYNATIPRNLPPGADVIQVTATDDDVAENGNITYRLVHKGGSYIFVIDKSSGVISLSSHGQLAQPLYILNVEATDRGNPPRSGYTTVVVIVRGYVYNRTNLHPVFKKPEYEAYLVKIAPIGSVVTIVRAYDPDNLDERNIVYSIYRGDDRTFQIDSKSGVIRTKGELSADIYMLYIAAEYSDQVRDRLQSEQRKNITVVKITVKEVDITKPVFLKSHYQARVREDATINTLVLKVEATDEKMSIQSHLNYSIPNPRGTFFIDSRSGEIRVATKLDYEKTTRYVFVVSVNEVPETSQSSCTDVTIDVVDVNDNTPTIVYAPKSIELKKSRPVGELIGQVKATDRDQGANGKIKYYLENDYEVFRIDHDTGRIYTRAVPACCEVIYELTVEAKDEGIPPRSTTVTVTVISPKADRVNHVSTEADSGNNIPTKGQRSHQVRTKTDGHRQLHTKTDRYRQLHTKTDEYPTTSHVGNQGGHNGDKGYPGHAARSGHESGNHKRIIIVASSCACVFVLASIFVAVYCKRRRRNLRIDFATTMRYSSLQTEENSDDEMLNLFASEEDHGRPRLTSESSDLSAGSQENLLRRENQC